MSVPYSDEEFPDAVVSTLQAQLPAMLDAVAAQYAAADAAAGRTIDLPVPRAEDYYPGGASAITRYPALEVAVPDVSIENFSLGMYDADTLPVLIVRVWASHARFEVLYRRSYRYAAAVFAVLTTPRALPGSATVERARRAYRFNPETAEHDEIVSGVVLGFELSSTKLAP